MIAAFFAGVPPAQVAIVAGAVLLLTRRIKSEKVYAEIDWTLLLMFAGLFIVVAGLERQRAFTRRSSTRSAACISNKLQS